MKTIADIDWDGKIAVLRTDLNVPLVTDGGITCVADDARITAAVPTINAIINAGGGVVLLSHLGRPAAGVRDAALSLRPVATALANILTCPLRFCPLLSEATANLGSVLVLENTRFNAGELANDDALAKCYAALGDVFVMDAFASAHRREASVAAIATTGIECCAGLLVEADMRALTRVLEELQRPFVCIFGGAKISTKLAAIRHLSERCDAMIVGGGIANTLLMVAGTAVGTSLVQTGMQSTARALLQSAGQRLLLPQDVVVAHASTNLVRQTGLSDIDNHEKILDIGDKTRVHFAELIQTAKTIIWNGPIGLFEQAEFAGGTAAIATAVADSSAFSLIGGGDTIAAARRFQVIEQMSYVSTAGGALLEYLAGNTLPGLVALT